MLSVEYGWCNTRPLTLPKKCRWCSGELRLFRGRAIVCPTCDETWWWHANAD